MLSLKFFVYSKYHSAHSEQSDQRMRRQVVAYKKLKTIEKSLNFQAQKVVAVAYRRWSFTRDSYGKSLTGKVLVFWMSGRLWEAVAHGGSTVCTLSSSISKCLFVVSSMDAFSDKSFICSQALLSSDSSCAVLFSRLPRILLSNSRAVDALVPVWLALVSSARRAINSCKRRACKFFSTIRCKMARYVKE